MKVLVTGSFDPITLGHLAIINRAKSMATSLVIGVFNNETKEYMFDLESRVELVKLAVSDMDNVEVFGSSGMVSDFCKTHNIDVIVRGFRDYVDYAYEVDMAIYNYKHCGVHTYLLQSDAEHEKVSSTKARECIISGNDIEKYLPKSIIERARRIKNG